MDDLISPLLSNNENVSDLAAMGLSPEVLGQLLFGSDEDLRAVGRLTILFSLADDTVTGRCAFLVGALKSTAGTDQRELRRRVAGVPFPRRLRLIKRNVQVVSTRFGVASDHLVKLIERGFDLATHRHDIVHGGLIWNEETDQVVFANLVKNRQRVADAEAIDNLADEIVNWSLKFGNAFDSFFGLAIDTFTRQKTPVR